MSDTGQAIVGCSSYCGWRGEPSGINRIYRLNREEGFTVRKRRTRRTSARNARNSDDIIINCCRGRSSRIGISTLIVPGRAGHAVDALGQEDRLVDVMGDQQQRNRTLPTLN